MTFKPPALSKTLLTGVPFDMAADTATAAKKRFDKFDASGPSDPNNCKALLQFPNGTVFWSSKMAVDADGAAAGPGRKPGSKLDPFHGPGTTKPDGQDETSFRYLPKKKQSLSAELVGYIAIPHISGNDAVPFHPDLAVGDIGVVIYKDEIAAVIVGDVGPAVKIGEGSIHLHEELMPRAPDPCKRDSKGHCDVIHDSSIPQDVLFFVFPHSSFGAELTPDNIETKVKERAFARFNELKGS